MLKVELIFDNKIAYPHSPLYVLVNKYLSKLGREDIYYIGECKQGCFGEYSAEKISPMEYYKIKKRQKLMDDILNKNKLEKE